MPHSLSMMQAYLRLGAAISRAQGSSEVCEAGLDCVREQLGFERAAILSFEPAGSVRFRAQRGLSEAYRAAVEGQALPWTAGTSKPGPVVVLDTAKDAHVASMRAAILAEGIERMAFVPLWVRSRLIGKLMLYGGGPESYGPEHMLAAIAVADTIAIALDGHHTQERLREANGLLTAITENLPEALAFMDADGRLVYATHRIGEFFSLPLSEMQGRTAREFAPLLRTQVLDMDRIIEQFEAGLVQGRPVAIEVRHTDGRLLEVTTVPTSSPGARVGFLVRWRDVTAHRDLEARLRHAQKMDSIGRLAGGVAHDFNNMLTAMIGYMDLVAAGLPPEAEEQAYIAQALDAAEQASGLTRQLLAFARRQPVHPTAQDMNALLERMAPLLRRLVPEDIEIVTRIQADPGWVLADAGQLEQVLVNLAYNARDAMPDGGLLTLSTSRARSSAPGGGEEVALEVADTGVGMDAETREHLFEPFYTTKEEGQGAGLGLATVYGIVQQFGGKVEVSSEPGRGARFRVLLPAADPPAAPRPAEGGPGGHETVLLVEDDVSVRGLVTAMLGRLGYVVLVAGRADAALPILEGHAGEIHLLIADIVMPGMSGRELASRAMTARPNLRVLLTSGYAGAGGGPHVAGGFVFMPKPFSIETLAQRVREALASPAAAAGQPSNR